MTATSTYSVTDSWVCDQDGTTATTTRTTPEGSPAMPAGWAVLSIRQANGQNVLVDLCPKCFAPYQPTVAAFLVTHPTGT